jgi:DNA-binding transcriptional ArsR family regulator
MSDQTDYKQGAQIFKALGHPIRLLIVENLLEEEKCVNDIHELVDVSQPNISQHLNILRFSGIVDFRQQGNLRCYFLKDPLRLKNIMQFIK